MGSASGLCPTLAGPFDREKTAQSKQNSRRQTTSRLATSHHQHLNKRCRREMYPSPITSAFTGPGSERYLQKPAPSPAPCATHCYPATICGGVNLIKNSKLKKRLMMEVSSGAMSINQARRILGKSPIPGGDVRFIRIPK